MRGDLAVSQALYRKYRSKKLSELIGQKHVTDILARAIQSGRISHAYLLTGPRGVGKTSVARILAYEINGLEYDETGINLDIIEIDAASNNGVEDVRDLREKVQIAPVAAKKKIYIIDEVHMLSKAAFNALLKTLEEPPEHVVFILATTNVEKLPDTIVSRTQRFNFRPISITEVKNHLADIAAREDIKIDEPALELIALRGDGSFRDSISLLDQLSNLVDKKTVITTELIEDALGMAPQKLVNGLMKALDQKKINDLVDLLDNAYIEGVEVMILVDQLIKMISEQIIKKPEYLTLLDSLLEVPKNQQPKIKLLAVLGSYTINGQPANKPASKTMALAATTVEISAPVKELEIQASKPKPKMPLTTLDQKQPSKPFDWNSFVEYTKQNYIAIYSVLSKCNYEIENDDLTIYTGNSFYKKKLDDTKYSPLLSQCLQNLGVYGLNIHTVPTTAPIKDSQAAAIAAIMGGGEEVSLETI